MKILIAGEYNYFTVSLISRLKREKHNTYIICGKQREDAHRYKQKADVEYPFEVSEGSAFHIVDDVRPDVILFMGAFDTAYKWSHSKHASNDYLSALSNILGIAGDCPPRRFIYLSTQAAEGIKGIAISTGESLCLNHKDSGLYDISVLRLSSVYGVPEYPGEYCGELSRLLSCAISGEACVGIRPEIAPLYVSDAVEAIYRVMNASPQEAAVYDIDGGNTLDIQMFQELLKTIDPNAPAQSELDKAFKPRTEKNAFETEYKFKPMIAPATGIHNVATVLSEHNLSEIKHQQKRKSVSLKERLKALSFVTPFVECLLLFALVPVAVWLGYPEPVQLLILYIVLSSAIFGRAQMFIAILCSVLFYTFFHSADTSLYLIVSDYRYIFTVLIMIISGFVVSGLKDKLIAVRNDKDFIIKNQEKEISELNSMLNTSRDIKVELESRLLNHSDSLSKIYDIVSRLDAVETRKVFIGALRVVSDIMRSKDVSIYMSGNNSSYFRCVASSTPKARESMPSSIKITEFTQMYEALRDENVYINRTLDSNLPVMALAISTGEEFNVVIMLWSMEFKDLGLYHINLFLVLRMIITNSIGRAYQYELATHEQRYIENTNILRKESFAEVLEDQRDIMEDTQTPYQLLRITTDNNSLPEISSVVSGMLRTTDYLGIGDADELMIILGGTSANDLPFVTKRLESKGIHAECIAT